MRTRKILKKTWKPTDQGKDTYIAFNCAKFLANHLRLTALVEGKSISQLLRTMLNKRYAADDSLPEACLCTKIAEKYTILWMSMKAGREKSLFKYIGGTTSGFLEHVKKELKQEGLSSEHISDILAKIKV